MAVYVLRLHSVVNVFWGESRADERRRKNNGHYERLDTIRKNMRIEFSSLMKSL